MEHIIRNTKYVDPMIDVAFKMIFGSENNKRLIKELVEHVFRLKITDLRFSNVEHPGMSLEDRSAVFDLECNSKEIGDFIVEVQVKEQFNFAKRALYYTTFPIAAQAPKGKWDYNFKPVFFLGLLNFSLDEASGKSDGCIHRYALRDEITGKLMTDSLQFVFMEVKDFNKPLEECVSFEEKFLYFFKNMPTFAERPDTQNDSYFEELISAAEIAKMDRTTMDEYNRRLKILRDNYNADEFMKMKAAKEGLEKGLAEGKAAAIAEMAVKMLQKGFEISDVSDITGLSEAEIRSIKTA